MKENTIDGDMEMIAVNSEGAIGIEFNSKRMHRGWEYRKYSNKILQK